MTFKTFINDSGIIILILNTLFFLISYLIKDKGNIYFILYMVLCLFIQLFSTMLFDMKENNLFLSHYLFIGQFIFLSLLFAKLLDKKRVKNSILLLIPLISIPFIVYNIQFPEKYKAWNVLEIGLTSIPLLVYSFLFFMKKIEQFSTKKYIYFNTGFFMYTLCSTLLFTLGNIGTRELKSYVWNINSSLYLVFQILIFVEWFKNFRKNKIF